MREWIPIIPMYSFIPSFSTKLLSWIHSRGKKRTDAAYAHPTFSDDHSRPTNGTNTWLHLIETKRPWLEVHKSFKKYLSSWMKIPTCSHEHFFDTKILPYKQTFRSYQDLPTFTFCPKSSGFQNVVGKKLSSDGSGEISKNQSWGL